MEKLQRYKHLVSAEWVNELISGSKPAEYENDKFIVVHSHYRNREAYLSGHIPGAIDMDTLALEAPETKEILASSHAELVCVRSWPELIGEVSGYNYIEAKGRIPGAVFADCGSDAYHMENYRSNIGNFPDEEVDYFLGQLSEFAHKGDKVMIGFDLKKSPEVIIT